MRRSRRSWRKGHPSSKASRQVESPDVVVVGSGPNGLTAAARMAVAGRRVLVLEAETAIGGGTRTEELTLPGFRHDTCSAIHPFGVVSPGYRTLGLDVDWITPPVAASHPLDDGRAAGLFNNVDETAQSLSERDGRVWRRIFAPLVADLDQIVDKFLAERIIPNPINKADRIMTLHGARSAAALASRFEGEGARALIAGLAAHSVAKLDSLFTGGVALLMGAIGNAVGWPLIRGGSARISDSLAAIVTENGGEIVTGQRVTSLDRYDHASVLLDLSPPEARVVGRLRMNPTDIVSYGRWRPGPGVFKIDYALDRPVPWADDVSPRAGTVHLGGTFEEIAAAEAAVIEGKHPDRPFVLFAQQSDFDPTRAPEGKRTGWAYCHVPNGSDVDMTSRIEAQIERFAPGFSETVLQRFTRDAPGFEAYNSNYVGGDIGGGAFGVRRFIPKVKSRYKVGDRLFACSANTPPGGGAHGMCGWNAAGAALR
ncbi:MAG: NAD(P)/FAD-dependent oxidoreductase [Actinobacteria bacterium]|nr:MAG: NAD(P)/FAD-dependent oxidoreductase [Actinomycetota bacterium]